MGGYTLADPQEDLRACAHDRFGVAPAYARAATSDGPIAPVGRQCRPTGQEATHELS